MSFIQVTQTCDRQPAEAVVLASPYAASGSFAFIPGQKTFGATFYSEVGTIDKNARGAGIANASGTTSSYVSVGQVQQALVGSSWVFQFSPLDTSLRWLSGTVDTGFNYFEDIIVNSDSTGGGVSAGRLAFGMRRDGGVNASRVGNTTNVCLTVGAVHTAVILLTSTSSFEIWVDGVNQPVTYGTTNSIGDTAGLTEFPLVLLNRNLRNAFSNGTNVDLFLYARLPLLVDAAVISRNPWQLFEPQSIWVPVSTGTSLVIDASLGTAQALGHTATVDLGLAIDAELGTAQALGYTASIGGSLIIDAELGTAQAFGYTATVNVSLDVNAGLGAATALGYTATISSTNTINTSLGIANALGYQATVGASVTIDAALGTAAALGYPADVLFGEVTISIVQPYITVYFWKRIA